MYLECLTATVLDVLGPRLCGRTSVEGMNREKHSNFVYFAAVLPGPSNSRMWFAQVWGWSAMVGRLTGWWRLGRVSYCSGNPLPLLCFILLLLRCSACSVVVPLRFAKAPQVSKQPCGLELFRRVGLCLSWVALGRTGGMRRIALTCEGFAETRALCSARTTQPFWGPRSCICLWPSRTFWLSLLRRCLDKPSDSLSLVAKACDLHDMACSYHACHMLWTLIRIHCAANSRFQPIALDAPPPPPVASAIQTANRPDERWERMLNPPLQISNQDRD